MAKNKSNKTKYSKKSLTKPQKEEVQRIVEKNIETKALDFQAGIGAAYGTTAIFQDLTAIGQGATSITRLGDQIKLKKIDFRMYFTQQGAGSVAENVTRILIFQWRPDNGTAPVVADLLDLGPGGTTNVWSQHNFDNRALFKVLKDITFVSNGSIANENDLHSFVFTVDCDKLPKVNYDFGVNTGDHHVYMMILASNAASVNNSLYTSNNRVYFKDA